MKTKNKEFSMKKYIVLFLIFNLVSLILYSCEETTKPETVAFSGTVTLEGKTDHSPIGAGGVKVSLYKPVELDTALVRINRQYPNIGVQITQETEFDHREHVPLYSKTTNTTGSWSLEDVTPGIYNIVAEKDSFGWQTVYEKQSGATQFDLYKNVFLTSMSNSSYTFESGRCYIINKDVYFQDMTALNFEANSKIIFATNDDLQINNSTLAFPASGWVHITGDDGITNAKMIIDESNFVINRLKFTSMNKGIKFNNCTDGTIKNSYFKNNGIAILPEFCTNLIIENIVVINNTDGILPKAGNMSITKSIIYKNNKGLENLSGDIKLTNSLFLGNFIGATFMSSQVSKVERCEFDRNNNSSLNIIGVDLEVFYNNFLNDSSCSIYINSEYASSGLCYPIINNNNFINEKLAISQNVNQYYFGTSYGNRADINVKENYWGTIMEYEISSKIYDYYKNPILGKVDFADYKLLQISQAGLEY